MPSSIKSFIHRFTGLANPAWLLRIGTIDQPALVKRGERGVILSYERRFGSVRGGVPVERSTHCDYSNATITGAKLSGHLVLSCFFGTRLERPSATKGSEITSCDFKDSIIIDGSLEESTINGCSFAQASIKHTKIGRMALCDVSHSNLSNIKIKEALACDFSGAILTNCDLSNADLSGSNFTGAVFENTNLSGAIVAGVNFSGSSGLETPTVESLILRGATLHNPIVWNTLKKMFPKADTINLNRLAGITNIALFFILISSLILIGIQAFSMDPTEPNPVTIDLSRGEITESSETPRQRTLDTLRLIRTSVQEAHNTMVSNGGDPDSWPKITDLSNGHFDLDGSGEGESREVLIPNGIPSNPITSSSDVIANCDTQPTQDTLNIHKGWLYCEQTGELFACAGSSGEATIDW